MSKYRAIHPSTEDLVAAIAQWCGVYKPPPQPVATVDISSIPDPRDEIRKAFAQAKFPQLGGVQNV